MIVTHDQPTLERFLRAVEPEASYLRCIGNVLNGKLVGVVGYDNYNGASIMAHTHGEGNWLTREFLRVMFHYPFVVCGVNVIIGLVPSGNARAIKFNKHLGFTTQLKIPGAHPDGSLVVMTMTRRECRYLHEERHGTLSESAAYA